MLKYYEDYRIHLWAEYSDKEPQVPTNQWLLNAQIYSAYSPNLDPFGAQFAEERQQAQLTYESEKRLDCRADYPPIPGLKVKDIMRASFVNVYTGSIETVKSLGYDAWGKPHANYNGVLSGINLWWHDRTVIEHWVYIDNARPSILAHWALHHLQDAAKQLASITRAAARDNSSYRKQEVVTCQQHFDNAKTACMLWVNRKVIDILAVADIEAATLGRGVQMGLF